MPGRVAISVFWLFGLGGLGIFFPYYSLYLRENLDLSGTQVGAVLATLPLVAVLAQPLWGQIADRTGSRARVLVALSLGAGGTYWAVSLGGGFASVLMLTGLLAFFSTPLVPTAVSVTFALAKRAGPHAFGLCRVWGTVGFLILVVAFPNILDAIQESRGLVAVPGGPAEPGLGIMFPLTGALIAVAGVVALAIPPGGALEIRAERGDWRALLSNGPYLRLLLVALLGYLTLQGPMALFPIFVRAHGGDLDTVSRLWVLMLIVEIPLVALSGASLERIGARGLLAVGLGAGALRWIALGFAADSWLLYPVQLLHGVVVAGLVIGGPLYVEAVVPESLRSTAQNVLGMVGVSVGGLLSNLGAGWLLEHFGADAPYRVGGIGALLLVALLLALLPAPRRSG